MVIIMKKYSLYIVFFLQALNFASQGAEDIVLESLQPIVHTLFPPPAYEESHNFTNSNDEIDPAKYEAAKRTFTETLTGIACLPD